MTLKELIQTKRAEIIAVAAKHGAYNIRVFGSVARDEVTEDSDIDFLVDYDSSNRSAWFPMGLMFDLENLLERKVDVTTVDMLKERIKDRVLKESVKL
jgi:uncharacterized protein